MMNKTNRRNALLMVLIALLIAVFAVNQVALAQAGPLRPDAGIGITAIDKTVKASKIKLNATKRTIYVSTVYNDPLNQHQTFKIIPTITPVTASANTDPSLVQFTSGNPKVAEVSSDGTVRAVKAGTANITVKLLDGSKKTAKCKITVKALPAQSLTVPQSSIKLVQKATYQIVPTIAPATVANKKVSYKTSNKKVATVTSAGVIKAVAPGTAKITVTAKSKTSVKTTITVTVDYTYRVYAISNGDYKYASKLPNWKPDLAGVKRMATTARINGGKVGYSAKSNLTAAQMRGYLQSIVDNKSIGPNDVTVFYYSGHGVEAVAGHKYNGALVGIDASNSSASDQVFVSVEELVGYLSKVPGQVIVILDSCFSGELITHEYDMKAKSAGSAIARKAALGLINQNIIDTFAAASPSVPSTPSNGMTAKDLSPITHARFHVIAAASDSQYSFAARNDKRNKYALPWAKNAWRSFASYGIEAGTSGAGKTKLKADTNRDKKVTMQELYTYTHNFVYYWLGDYSVVQAWPANDSLVAFAIN